MRGVCVLKDCFSCYNKMACQETLPGY